MISLFSLKDIVELQTERIGYRPSGSMALKKLKEELSLHLQRYPVDLQFYKFPIRYLDPIKVTVQTDTEFFYALPYVGCPPFFPYEQIFNVKGLLKFSTGLDEQMTDRIALKTLEPERVIDQAITLQNQGCKGIIFISPQHIDSELLNLITPIGNFEAYKIKSLKKIPIIVVSQVTGARLKELIEEVEISIEIEVKIKDGFGQNMIVTLGDGEHYLDLATHFDSPFERSDIMGANDNASGVAVFCELIRVFCNENLMPLNRKVRFIFYDCEEYNLYGCLSLLLDLNQYLNKHTYEKLFRTLINNNSSELLFFEQSQHLLEIDTVGKGTGLLYGTNSPYDIQKLLFKLDEINGIDKIRVSRDQGNIQYLKSLFGMKNCGLTHFLTLGGVDKIIHTPQDSYQNVDWDSLKNFTQFLVKLIEIILKSH